MPRRGTAHKRSDKALAPRLVKRLNIAITTATRSCSWPGWRACSCTIQDFNPEDIKDDSAPTVNEEKEPDIAFVASHITAGSVEARSSTVVKEEPKQLTYANESDNNIYICRGIYQLWYPAGVYINIFNIYIY